MQINLEHTPRWAASVNACIDETARGAKFRSGLIVIAPPALLLSLCLHLSAETPQVNPGGVVNAANYASAPVSAGSIISVFGTNLASEIGSANSLPHLAIPSNRVGNTGLQGTFLIAESGVAAPRLAAKPQIGLTALPLAATLQSAQNGGSERHC